MRFAEFVRNILVGSATVPVVVTKDPSRVPESPANRDGVRIVVSENPGSRRILMRNSWRMRRMSWANGDSGDRGGQGAEKFAVRGGDEGDPGGAAPPCVSERRAGRVR